MQRKHPPLGALPDVRYSTLNWISLNARVELGSSTASCGETCLESHFKSKRWALCRLNPPCASSSPHQRINGSNLIPTRDTAGRLISLVRLHVRLDFDTCGRTVHSAHGPISGPPASTPRNLPLLVFVARSLLQYASALCGIYPLFLYGIFHSLNHVIRGILVS